MQGKMIPSIVDATPRPQGAPDEVWLWLVVLRDLYHALWTRDDSSHARWELDESAPAICESIGVDYSYFRRRVLSAPPDDMRRATADPREHKVVPDRCPVCDSESIDYQPCRPSCVAEMYRRRRKKHRMPTIPRQKPRKA